MRVLAATLALVATLLLALLGGAYWLSARYEGVESQIQAKTRRDQLAAAGAGLLAPKDVARRRAAAQADGPKVGASNPESGIAGRHRMVGIVFAAGAALGLLAVVLLFLNRARRLALAGVGLVGVAGAAGLVLEGRVTLMIVICVLTALALLLAWRAAPRKPRDGGVVPSPPEAVEHSQETPA